MWTPTSMDPVKTAHVDDFHHLSPFKPYKNTNRFHHEKTTHSLLQGCDNHKFIALTDESHKLRVSIEDSLVRVESSPPFTKSECAAAFTAAVKKVVELFDGLGRSSSTST